MNRVDPPTRESKSVQEWAQDGRLHRVGGPARICFAHTKEWFYHGMRHNLEGPAIIEPVAVLREIKRYFIYDTEYTYEEWLVEREAVKLREEII